MKVLVAAASRHGATQEIAEAIGRTLDGEGMHAFVAPVAEAGDPTGYDAVILGSAVYMGHWLDPATKFVESRGAALSARPTWLFSSGPIGDPPRPNESQAVDVDDLVSKTHARGHKLFAGKLDKGKLGFGERAVMLAFHAAEGDYRNWQEVEAWARVIAGELQR
jgi:menaquinone-dependent protoporphyrinogen oxidase